MRALYITNGMASTLNSSFELSRRLSQAGHEVVYASPAEVSEAVRAQGYEFVPLVADREFFERAAADRRPGVAPIALLRWLARRRRLRRESIANDEIERLIDRLAPDLLLIDIEMHFAVIVSARFSLPTFLPIVWFSVFRQSCLPPLHTTLFPGETVGARAAIALAWWRLRFARLRKAWWAPLRRWLRGGVLRPVAYDTFERDDLVELARSRRFPLSQTDSSPWLRPHVYTHLTVLSFTAREMELPQVRHPLVEYVGPMIDLRRRESLEPEQASRWDLFKRCRESEEAPGPLVYCSLGSFWAADSCFLGKVVDVFRGRPEWRLVLGLGGQLEVDELGELPANALVLDWAPQLEVLALADCAITHGGITTINECIELGVPMVVYSTRHVDQNGCAVRVAHHGLGVLGDTRTDGVAELVTKIERVLGDVEIRRRVESMRDRFARYRTEKTVLQLIEEAVGSGEGRETAPDRGAERRPA